MMTTAVSIGLYLVAALLAAIVGATAEQYKRDKDMKAPGKFAAISFAIIFLMAAALQVAA